MCEGYRHAIKAILKQCDFTVGVSPDTEQLEKLFRYAARDYPNAVSSYISIYFERASKLEIDNVRNLAALAVVGEEVDKLREIGMKLMKALGIETSGRLYPKFKTKNGKEFFTVESAVFEWVSSQKVV